MNNEQKTEPTEIEEKLKTVDSSKDKVEAILKMFGNILIYEDRTIKTNQKIVRWYDSYAWLVKTKKKGLHLVVGLSVTSMGSSETLEIKAFKATPTQMKDESERFDKMNWAFVVNSYQDYMNHEKLEKRLNGFLKLF